MTVHGFNGRCIESFCLACLKFDDAPTPTNICSIFESVKESWNIEREKIVAIVTDNAENISNAVDLFLGQGKHASCFAHSLNSVVKKALEDSEEISSMIQDVKDIVTYSHHSPKATSLLNSLQDCPLKLYQDVPARWNSTYTILEGFIVLKDHIARALSELDSNKDMIPNSTLKILDVFR